MTKKQKKIQPDTQEAPDNGHQDILDDLDNMPWMRVTDNGLTVLVGGNGSDPEVTAEALRVKTIEYDDLSGGGDVIITDGDIPEPPIPIDLAILPKSLYVITRQGVALKRDPTYIRQVAETMNDQNINKFVAFNRREPVLIALMKGSNAVHQLALPDASKITTTPAQLYSKAITYPKIIARLVKRRVDRGQEKFAKTSKLVWVIALSVITLFIIFMLVVVAMDNADSSGDSEEQTSQQQIVPVVNPANQKADLVLTPTPTAGTPQNDPRVVVIPAEGN